MLFISYCPTQYQNLFHQFLITFYTLFDHTLYPIHIYNLASVSYALYRIFHTDHLSRLLETRLNTMFAHCANFNLLSRYRILHLPNRIIAQT